MKKAKEPICRACGHVHHPPGRFTEVGYCDAGPMLGEKTCGCSSCRCLPCIKSIEDPAARKVMLETYPSDTEGGAFF